MDKKFYLKEAICSGLNEISDWNRLDYGHTAQLMIDSKTGKVWADLFLDENTYKIYHSKSIKRIPIEEIRWNLPDGKTLSDGILEYIQKEYKDTIRIEESKSERKPTKSR